MTYNIGFVEQQALATGESTIPRRMLSTTSIVSGNSSLRLTYFTARKAETVTQVRTMCGTAQVGATLARIGIYTEAANGDITLVASTDNDTNLWIAANTAYTKSLAASFNKLRGQRYAVGLLVVGTSTAPTFAGQIPGSAGTDAGLSPRLGGLVGGQSDLPSSVANASISATTQCSYAVLLP